MSERHTAFAGLPELTFPKTTFLLLLESAATFLSIACVNRAASEVKSSADTMASRKKARLQNGKNAVLIMHVCYRLHWKQVIAQRTSTANGAVFWGESMRTGPPSELLRTIALVPQNAIEGTKWEIDCEILTMYLPFCVKFKYQECNSELYS